MGLTVLSTIGLAHGNERRCSAGRGGDLEEDLSSDRRGPPFWPIGALEDVLVVYTVHSIYIRACRSWEGEVRTLRYLGTAYDYCMYGESENFRVWKLLRLRTSVSYEHLPCLLVVKPTYSRSALTGDGLDG
jgi:hypothetical protein